MMRFVPAIGHLLGPDASEADARRQREAEAFTDEPHICLTRTGGSIMAASRTLRVHASKGYSALAISWQMQQQAIDGDRAEH